MNLTFEYLREEDLEETYQLCMRSFGENIKFDDVKRTYKFCRQDPHYHFIVGKADGKIVAYATVVFFHNLFDGTNPVATIWYVCVHEDYRRQGIGEALFEEIERLAKEEQCEIIYFTCLKNNEGAQKFYRSVGYSDDKEKAFVKYLYEDDDFNK